MKNAIIIHGMPSKEEYLDLSNPRPSQNHWFPWLKRELEKKGIVSFTPEMPTPYEARYNEWASVMSQFSINEDTILVGHSLGGGFLVRWLSENEVRVGRVVLVAPWLDPNKELQTGFFDFTIDPSLTDRTKDITVFISHDDDQEELTSFQTLKNAVPKLQAKEFDDKGHFILEHTKTEEFPELRDFLLE
ncbi:MAG: hypothetical protein RIQ41_245 [Candidatus Parcubacteria bacterium]|jgi:predicted alpha/beta hydrolase family esterase